jgi:desulfoferrodoxin-like iron-binding protein
LQSKDFDAKIFYGVAIEMANQIGKRYVCKKCGSEFIVTRAGDGTVTCCGQPMELKK